jgi:DNA-binding transcriptional LysR family regulator
MLDVRRLRLLRELHARGTIAAVADALQYTPSAVSQQLAVLERESGVALLERVGRGVRLTDAGERLVEHAEAVIARLEAAEADLAAGGETRGRVRVSAFQTAARALVAPAFTELSRGAPGIRTELVEMEAEASLPLLRIGEVDVVVAEEYEHTPRPRDDAFERRSLGLDRLVLAIPAGHPASARPQGELQLHELAAEPWAAPREGTAFTDELRRLCRGVGGFEPDLRHQANDVRLLLQLVASGFALALVPSLGLQPEPGVDLRPTPRSREIFASVRRGSAGHPAVSSVLTALTEHAGHAGLAPVSAA